MVSRGRTPGLREALYYERQQSLEAVATLGRVESVIDRAQDRLIEVVSILAEKHTDTEVSKQIAYRLRGLAKQAEATADRIDPREG